MCLNRDQLPPHCMSVKHTQNVYLQPYEPCIFAEDVRWQVLQLVVLQIPKVCFFGVTNGESSGNHNGI